VLERLPCSLPAGLRRLLRGRATGRERAHFEHPLVEIGSSRDYRYWNARAREYLRESGRDPATLDRTDATINYDRNRVLLFNLPDPRNELSVGETFSHEVVHALLEQLGERWAARSLDAIARPAGAPDRIGGV
jgi:hypothetical protein